MGWSASFDGDGPQNGDVVVRNGAGRLVALIYAAATPDETMRRAESLMLADPAQKAVGDLTSDEMLELSPEERTVAISAIAASEDFCMLSGCMDFSERPRTSESVTRRATLELSILKGVAGNAVYLADERIAGPSHNGSMREVATYLVEAERVAEIAADALAKARGQ